jgi:hypothetical protein
MQTSQGFPYWKGDNYKAGGLLVLAESAYNKRDPTIPVDPNDCIQDVIRYLRERKEYQRWHLHFKRTFLTVRGTDATKQSFDWNEVNAKDFFDNIVYANYIVPPVGKSAENRPSDQQWDSAWPSFRNFLIKMSPGWVLTFGFGVWGNILDYAGDEVSGRTTDSEVFVIGNSVKARICVVPHPSSWNRLHPRYTPEMANEHFRNKFCFE